MCGLIFLYGGEAAERLQRSRTALDMLARRGPDASDIHVAGEATFGHRRLAIVDLVGNRQPLLSPDGRFVLVFNGEIYNYRERREALRADWTFRSASDTEVLLATLLLKGSSGLTELDGMWAFALWDTQTRELILGRDRLGKKPLYIAGGGDRFAAASELPALRVLDGSRWSEDENSTADYLRYGYTLPGTTFFSDIAEVLPGHVVTWRPGEAREQRPWWTPPMPGTFAGRRGEISDALRAAFRQSVRNRLVADVEVGAFLSGGIDSSLVVAQATELLDRPLRTFSAGFAQESFDESRFARMVAAHCHTEHHVTRVERFDEQLLEDLLEQRMGQPFADPSLLPMAMIAEDAARHVKVALSGDGADELFGGYQRYQAQVLMSLYSRMPAALRRPFESLLQRLPESDVHHSRSLLKKAQMFAVLAKRDAAPYVAPEFFGVDDVQRLAPHLHGKGHVTPRLAGAGTLKDLGRMMHMDVLVYLPQDILVKVDRATMHYSVEARAPFLGKDVVELAMSLPATWHRGRIAGKQLLREAFAGRLPQEIWRRRKQGFGVPVAAWFKGELGERMLECLAIDPGPLDPVAVRVLLDHHRSGRRDHGLSLWLLYSYLRWRSRVA